MVVALSPKTEAKLREAARREGVEPDALVEKLVNDYQPHAANQPVYTAENDPLMAHLEARIATALTNPDEIREAEAELLDFERNMNANRRAVGGRIPYPDFEPPSES